MFRFLHAADLHLDSPLWGLDRYEGAPVEVFRRAGRGALENLVQLALQQKVQFVLLAGDVFDGDWPDVNTGLFFVSQMGKLRQQGIPVYLISGNHDAANRMSRSLPYPNNVYVFPSDRPSTQPVPEMSVAIHGQSYDRPDVRTNLAAGYPPPIPGYFNIGLLHTALTGWEGHQPYAPCHVEELLARGYHYWALGHVHQHKCVWESGTVRMEFPGNIQGRHIRETGPKGCLIVEVDGDHHMQSRFYPLDVCRWACVEVDCQGVASKEELLHKVEPQLEEALTTAEDRPLAVRVVLRGECPLHEKLLAHRQTYRDDIRSQANALAPERLWIEKLQIETTAPSAPGQEQTLPEEAFSEIERVVQELLGSSEKLSQMLDTKEWNQLWNRLPPELREGEEALTFSNPHRLQELLQQAKALLLEGPETAENRR